jgi:hypothetical protein
MDMNISMEFPMESLKERQFRLEISTFFFCYDLKAKNYLLIINPQPQQKASSKIDLYKFHN